MTINMIIVVSFVSGVLIRTIIRWALNVIENVMLWIEARGRAFRLFGSSAEHEERRRAFVKRYVMNTYALRQELRLMMQAKKIRRGMII